MQDQGDAPGADFWEQVRRSVIGGSAVLETPFGRRRLTYADHTASGRAVGFIEDYLRETLALYGNTHTEDDATGTLTSSRLRDAEAAIKRLVNAGPEHKIIAVGAGTTAAVHQLQQILGIYVPPAGKDLFGGLLKGYFPPAELEALREHLRRSRPVVFVGPYEHHSNEVSWRECFAEVVEIELDARGMLDLGDLRRRLERVEYRDRRKIGAFSAASNVSGVKTPVSEVARILHQHDALAFFDFAALAPYEPIDMRPDPAGGLDAIYFSPHKFLGGPGSCGILIFHKRIYRADLPPTIGAGGTVDFVNFDGQAYSSDIEVREKAGTPGVIQTLRAALAMELKEKLGQPRISAREHDLVHRAYQRLAGHPAIDLMGDVGPDDRLPIFSFNIRVGSSWLHPRYVTRLLNDLFGVQSRAGCSCAAPYGHRVLHIDGRKSDDLRKSIMCGNVGLKPGWARVNFHFLHTDAEVDFICRAILFVAEHGRHFLPLYTFDIHTGTWEHKDFTHAAPPFGIDEAVAARGSADRAGATAREADLDGLFAGYLSEAVAARGSADRAGAGAQEPDLEGLFSQYLSEAERLSRELQASWSGAGLKTTEADLIPFVYY